MRSKEELLRTIILVCLGGLIFILPAAHTTSIRSFFFITALVLWFARIWLTGDRKILGTPLDLPFLLFFLAIAISLFTSLNLSYSLSELRGEFLTCFALFYLTANNIKSDTEVLWLLAVFFAGILSLDIYGIVDFFVIDRSDPFDLTYRLGSYTQGYEAFGQHLITILPFNLLAVVFFKDYRIRALLVGFLLLNTIVLYLTHTRGAWLAFWVELLLISLFIPKKLAAKTILVVLLFVAPALFVSVMPSNLVWHGEKGFSATETDIPLNTGNIRLTMWKASLEELKKNPFKGSGYGKTTFRYRFNEKGFSSIEQSHNTFVNIAIQLGVQGLMALLFMIFIIIRFNWREFKSSDDKSRSLLFFATLTMTAGFFTANQFAEFFIDDTAMLFWLLVGFSAAIVKNSRISDEPAGMSA